MKAAATYIASRNPSAARTVAAGLRAAGAALGKRAIGRPGRIGGTFEKPVSGVPYILVYAIDAADNGDERVVILRVIHMPRDWPAGKWPAAN